MVLNVERETNCSTPTVMCHRRTVDSRGVVRELISSTDLLVDRCWADFGKTASSPVCGRACCAGAWRRRARAQEPNGAGRKAREQALGAELRNRTILHSHVQR